MFKKTSKINYLTFEKDKILREHRCEEFVYFQPQLKKFPKKCDKHFAKGGLKNTKEKVAVAVEYYQHIKTII